MQTVREAMEQVSVGRVFGAPVDRDGLTVVPVAKIGGGGAGGGVEPARDEEDVSGSGCGLGRTAKPLGVFVISNGRVRWCPAVDINKIIFGGQVVAVTALLVIRALIRARAGRGRHPRGAPRAMSRCGSARHSTAAS